MRDRHLFITFLALLVITAVSLTVFYLSPPPTPSFTQNEKIKNTSELNAKGNNLENKQIVPQTNTTSSSEILPTKKIFIHVQLLIEDKKYETDVDVGSSIYDVMKKLRNTQGLLFTTREYSGLGQFVEEINGVREDKQKGIYWLFYVNGQSANIGISNYIIKPNDLISWKYAKAQF